MHFATTGAPRIRLGSSGLTVSPICYGSWQLSPKFWGEQSHETIARAMRHAFGVGINFYDTADAYGDGLSEQVLGAALKDFPRQQVVIATKVFNRFYADGRRHGDLSRDYILAECEESLKRLQTDYIDLYQCHSFDMSTDIAETADAMDRLVKAGKIRAYGMSNFTVQQMELARKHGNFTTNQPLYNLLQRDAEDDVLPWCRANDVGVLVFSPLMNGLLTGKFDGTEKFSDLRANRPAFQPDTFPGLAARIRNLAPIAQKYKMTITQLVLAVTLQNPLIQCAIVGIKTPEQIEEAAAVMGRTVSREDFYVVRRTVGTF